MDYFPFDTNFQEEERDTDPDSFLSEALSLECKYYTEEEIKATDEHFSLIHFNSRSLNRNFSKIKEYLSKFKFKFSVIAVSETWLGNERGHIELDDYDLFYQNRKNTIFLRKGLNYKMVQEMSITVSDIMECVTVEIINDKIKNVVISCIYRSPGSCVDEFNKVILKLFANYNSKDLFICGDFNFDLLKCENTKSNEFTNNIYSLGLYPLISKPTRITLDTATLIDNIFVNLNEKNIKSGVLITDVSDHLPVFAICTNDVRTGRQVTPKMQRVRTKESIRGLMFDLSKQDWKDVFVQDVNNAYDQFLDIFLSLYNYYCPYRKISLKTRENKWITKGLEKSC